MQAAMPTFPPSFPCFPDALHGFLVFYTYPPFSHHTHTTMVCLRQACLVQGQGVLAAPAGWTPQRPGPWGGLGPGAGRVRRAGLRPVQPLSG